MSYMGKKITAVVLAGGSGKRMKSETPKQYIPVCGIPMFIHSMLAFEKSMADDIVLVSQPGDEENVRELAARYSVSKLRSVVCGGGERYNSVYNALVNISGKPDDIVLIHDSARPAVSCELIERVIAAAYEYNACIPAVPVKDTVDESDGDGFVLKTLDRSRLFAVQTPQGFELGLIKSCYDRVMSSEELQKGITDDAMVVERASGRRVKITEGDYRNIKVTTPEDIQAAEAFIYANMHKQEFDKSLSEEYKKV